MSPETAQWVAKAEADDEDADVALDAARTVRDAVRGTLAL
jgi:hypothetical protein